MATGELGSECNEVANKIDPMIGITLLNMYLELEPSKFRGIADSSEFDEW